ncbi:DNA sulfur modification protein DndB [Bacillus velezensis]|uniref:DNA sulfur modification protein DndB n=1 Tax=Bacillus velezensis TaxID=492670 RepID=UPI003369C3EF
MFNQTQKSDQAGARPLSELIQLGGNTTDMQLKAFISNNLGEPTLLAKIPMYDFYRMSDVANERSENGEPVAQRKLDIKHATELARYIIKGLIAATIESHIEDDGPLMNTRKELQEVMGKQPYLSLQPMVANLRTAGRRGSNLRANTIELDNEIMGMRVWLGQRDILWIVDGQHRRKAIQMVIEFLEEVRLEQKYPPKKQSLFTHNRNDRAVPHDEQEVWMECYELTRGECTVNVEIHLGLDIIEERQLFHDLNNLAKKVEKSLALEFDSSNPVNAFIKDELLENGLLKLSSKEKVDWENDDGSFTRKDIVAVNAHLILNKSNINSATPAIVKPRLNIAKQFWEVINQIPGFGEKDAKTKTLAAQPVTLKAIAKLTYDFAFGRQSDEQLLSKLLDGITDIDFSHDNPMWRYYQLSSEQIEKYGLSGLTDYLPDNSTGNRDIGHYDLDSGWMRFGSKHNDIFPIIGDMIRWKLNLPSRHKA